MTEIEIREGLVLGTIVTCDRDELARLIAKATECKRRIAEAVAASKCAKCDGTGEVLPAGPSDAPVTFCQCPMGVFLARRIAEARTEERDRIGMVLCSAVKVEDGNTEINECYFRVTFLGALIWSAGGKCSEVEPAAHEFAASYRDRIAAAIRARGEQQSIVRCPMCQEFNWKCKCVSVPMYGKKPTDVVGDL